MSKLSLYLRLFALALLMAAGVHAQEDDAGVGIISGFMGGVAGIGTHVAGGVAFAAPTTRHLVPNIELSFSPTGNEGFRTGPDFPVSTLIRSRMYDVNAGLRVRFPSRMGHAVPYVGLGLGLLRFSTDVQQSGLSTGNVTLHQASNYLAGNFSGGVRYYITNHIGVQPEVKGYISNKNFARITVGLFYQFP